MGIDTTVGTIFSNVVAFSIIFTTAAVLNAIGITNINSATRAAEALRPVAGTSLFCCLPLDYLLRIERLPRSFMIEMPRTVPIAGRRIHHEIFHSLDQYF
ncbi:MAG: divalent metal cation transporter [Bradyrhizobium sp.]|nr:divalent metal cation transporter [Bradyrhizobium sp.]